MCTQKKLPLSHLATALDFTEAGFYAMLKNDTMKVKTLEKLNQIEKERTNIYSAEIKAQKKRLLNCRSLVNDFLTT